MLNFEEVCSIQKWYHATFTDNDNQWNYGTQIITDKNRNLRRDFGTGFYLTSNFNQALEWSYRKVKRRIAYEYDGNFDASNKPEPAVIEFDHKFLSLSSTDIFKFGSDEWASLILQNRLGVPLPHGREFTYGGLADGSMYQIVKQYEMDNDFERFKTEISHSSFAELDQICVHSQHICDVLSKKMAKIYTPEEIVYHSREKTQSTQTSSDGRGE